MSESLTNLGSAKVDATEETNIPDTDSTILTWSPVDGLVIEIDNHVYGGSGVPIYAELKDADGNDLPRDTEVILRWDTPSRDQPMIVSERLSNIRQYRTLSLKEQQNEEYREQTRTELKSDGLIVLDFEEVQVAINSSTQIDWDNSRLEIDRKAVTVRAED
ncbi:hypothetical protein [Halomicrobium mukohataei]|uniref:Uncharacterized protein n=1 Tax=Halomicrobium mukohataei (strain ATCC 700874 / DSM 12286 / JCM 9738 / NCIMB 13541) TaxID=485914 RepID=C7NYF4_HALMD|nr:hypothetical protein [Halomicrobium mukohataei]ACV46615.1 conserved hypothetical protein [Halomicrobium mukohataei DSM 12286]